MWNVLSVDDSPDDHVFLERFFLKLQLPVSFFSATSTAQADQVIGAHKIDLVLLDIFIPGPGRDGFVYLLKLKTDPATKDIPVIILTGLNSPKDAEMSLELGAIAYVEKGYVAENIALKEKVQEVLK